MFIVGYKIIIDAPYTSLFLPDISTAGQASFVEKPFEDIIEQQKQLENLKEEIQRLKGRKGRTKLKSSDREEMAKPGDKKKLDDQLVLGIKGTLSVVELKVLKLHLL